MSNLRLFSDVGRNMRGGFCPKNLAFAEK